MKRLAHEKAPLCVQHVIVQHQTAKLLIPCHENMVKLREREKALLMN